MNLSINEATFDTKIKQLLLEELHFFSQFLRDHGLRYTACGGTALGAVRHGGFIPWDDDIDIYMPRKDYERLFSIKDSLKGTKYTLVSYDDAGYYLPFAKFIDTTTTIWEMKRCPFLIGVFIDIFPLDFFDKSVEEIAALRFSDSRLFDIYRRHLFKYSVKDILEIISEGRVLSVCRHILDKIENIFGKKERLLQKIKQRQSQCAKQEEATSQYCACVPQWKNKGAFKSEWFKSDVMMPFEDMFIPVPVGYDEYLTVLYGDYMTPPSEQQRLSDHALNFRYYANLSESLDMAAVKRRIASGEKMKI